MICAVLDVWFNALTLCSKLKFFYINLPVNIVVQLGWQLGSEWGLWPGGWLWEASQSNLREKKYPSMAFVWKFNFFFKLFKKKFATLELDVGTGLCIVSMLLELLFFKLGHFSIPCLSQDDVTYVIDFLCTCWFYFLFYCIFIVLTSVPHVWFI